MLERLRKRLWQARHPIAAEAAVAAPVYPPFERTFDLPDGYPSRKVTLKIAIPPLPRRPVVRFTDHVTAADGRPGNTVLATMPGGFTISHDLGKNWRAVKVRGRNKQRIVHVRALGSGEYLLQAMPVEDAEKTLPLDLLVVDDDGRVIVEHIAHGPRWHGCRAIDQASGTLMYAEYPSGESRREKIGSRVLRSRDRGRSWNVVFERSAEQIRHFHFLQARPGHPGEWWLTSGDQPEESRIWVSKDDGDSWQDYTAGASQIPVGGTQYPRSIFRLTDLAWEGDDVVWGTDDVLWQAQQELRGGHLFRSTVQATSFAPRDLGQTRWHIRNLVDVGDFYVVLTQGSNLVRATQEERKPAALLLPKRAPAQGPALFPLLDIDVHSDKATAGAGFTFSKASRAAVNGTFFTFRAPFHLFPSGHQILRWDIRFS
jgi:hypothetical protein